MVEAFHFDPTDSKAAVPPALCTMSQEPHDLGDAVSMAWDCGASHAINRKIACLIVVDAAHKLSALGMSCNISLVEDIVWCLFQDVSTRWAQQQSRYCNLDPADGSSEAERVLREDRVVVVHRLWDVLDAFPATTKFEIVG